MGAFPQICDDLRFGSNATQRALGRVRRLGCVLGRAALALNLMTIVIWSIRKDCRDGQRLYGAQDSQTQSRQMGGQGG